MRAPNFYSHPMPRDFFLWLASRWCSHMGKQLLTVVIAWSVYQRTRDPFVLGLLGLTSALPFMSFSLWAGQAVDRHEKRRILTGAEAVLLGCGLLPFLFGGDRPPLFFLFFLVALKGAAVSFETTSASAFAQIIVAKENFPRAAAWNLTAFTTASIVGPLLGGGLLKYASASWAFGLVSFFIFLALLLVRRLPALPPTGTSGGASDWERMKEGLRFVRHRPVLLAPMALDMVAVLFGDAVALFPIFADALGAGPVGFGILRASPAAGSAAVSVLQILRPFVVPSWKNLKRVVLAFGGCMLGFALAPTLTWAAAFLALSGAMDGISVIIRQSLYQAHTPDAYRGRVTAVSGMFISASNEIGAFESGVAARFLGAPGSVVLGAAMTVLSVAGFGWVFRNKISEKDAGSGERRR